MVKEIISNYCIGDDINFMCVGKQQFIDFMDVCTSEGILFSYKNKFRESDKRTHKRPCDYFNYNTLSDKFDYIISFRVISESKVSVNIDISKNHSVYNLTELFRESKLNKILY